MAAHGAWHIVGAQKWAAVSACCDPAFSKKRRWWIFCGMSPFLLLHWLHPVRPLWKWGDTFFPQCPQYLASTEEEICFHKRGVQTGDIGNLWAREGCSKKKKRILIISNTLLRGPRCGPDAENLRRHVRLHDGYALTFTHVDTKNSDWSHWDY